MTFPRNSCSVSWEARANRVKKANCPGLNSVQLYVVYMEANKGSNLHLSTEGMQVFTGVFVDVPKKLITLLVSVIHLYKIVV